MDCKHTSTIRAIENLHNKSVQVVSSQIFQPDNFQFCHLRVLMWNLHSYNGFKCSNWVKTTLFIHLEWNSVHLRCDKFLLCISIFIATNFVDISANDKNCWISVIFSLDSHNKHLRDMSLSLLGVCNKVKSTSLRSFLLLRNVSLWTKTEIVSTFQIYILNVRQILKISKNR